MADRAKSLPKPELSYQRAMALYVVSGRGTVSTVKDCPQAAFVELMRRAARSAKDPDKARKVLDGLSFDQFVDRWYGLLILNQQGATLPVYATEEEARTSDRERLTGYKNDR